MHQAQDVYRAILKAAEEAHPKLAKALYNKYDEDRTAFIAAFEKDTEGKTHRDWAKPSCKKCYGTGIIGRRDSQELYCRCVEKNYFKYLKAFREEYNSKRDEKE